MTTTPNNDRLDAIFAQILGVPADNGFLVLGQLSAEDQRNAIEKLLSRLSTDPTLSAHLIDSYPEADPRTAAENWLIDRAGFAHLERDNLFPASFTIDDGSGVRHTEIVSRERLAFYENVFTKIVGSGLIGLYFAHQIHRDINLLTDPARLPLIYYWESRDDDTLRITINSAAIDAILEACLPRSDGHFHAVREWMTLRMEAYAKFLSERAEQRGAYWLQFPRWPGPAQRRYLSLLRELRLTLRQLAVPA